MTDIFLFVIYLLMECICVLRQEVNQIFAPIIALYSKCQKIGNNAFVISNKLFAYLLVKVQKSLC